ncbi:hypothetical protein [Entomohabitans teleogrylli]|uniref:hypothetical protein n=1 Tax=Entomohabitans teleogrylli TaxID=1384589 RepID=UPI00073D5D40|nr:hypothetical protein [Entomohabitans teleogrylli]
MKFFAVVTAVVAVLLACVILVQRSSSALEVRCEAEVLHTVDGPENSVTLDATATLFMLANGKGFVNLYGTLTDREVLWLVNRKIWFDWHYERNDNLYDITIRQVDIKKDTDKAPQEMMAKIYSQRFNMEIYGAGQNALYFRGVSTPFFFCVKQNKNGKAA